MSTDDKSNENVDSKQLNLHNAGHKIIHELKAIRETLNKNPSAEQCAEIPLLDEIITLQNANDKDLSIPLLAEVVLIPNVEISKLACSSWSLVENSLKHWATTLPEPVSSLSQRLISVMKAQLSSNWEAGFSKQSPAQLEQWQQWLAETQMTLDTEIRHDPNDNLTTEINHKKHQ